MRATSYAQVDLSNSQVATLAGSAYASPSHNRFERQ
jgi:hypothetical protein